MTSSWFLRQGAPHASLHDGFWKGDPDFIFMFNWHFLSYLNGLDVIRLLVFGWDFLTAGEILRVFGQNDPQNVNWEKSTCCEGTFLRHTASFEQLCVKLSLSVWPVQVRKKKGSKASRKKSQEVYISRMRGATPSGWIQTKLGKCVRFTDVIKREKFHCYSLRGFGALRCWTFHVAIRNQGRS